MWSGGEQGAESVEVALVLVRGEVFDEGLEFGGEFGADAAGALDFVEDAAEPLLGLLDGVHGVQQGVDAVGYGVGGQASVSWRFARRLLAHAIGFLFGARGVCCDAKWGVCDTECSCRCPMRVLGRAC